MSDIQVTSVDGNQINVTTGVVVGPLPSLQLAAGTGITIASGGGVSTISANLSELSIPANLADLSNVNGTPTTGQVLAWDGSSWAPADDQTGGSSSVANLADLADVSNAAPANGQALVWSGSEWAGGTIPPSTTVNGLSGSLTIVAGSGASVATSGSVITISSTGNATTTQAAATIAGHGLFVDEDGSLATVSDPPRDVDLAAVGNNSLKATFFRDRSGDLSRGLGSYEVDFIAVASLPAVVVAEQSPAGSRTMDVQGVLQDGDTFAELGVSSDNGTTWNNVTLASEDDSGVVAIKSVPAGSQRAGERLYRIRSADTIANLSLATYSDNVSAAYDVNGYYPPLPLQIYNSGGNLTALAVFSEADVERSELNLSAANVTVGIETMTAGSEPTYAASGAAADYPRYFDDDPTYSENNAVYQSGVTAASEGWVAAFLRAGGEEGVGDQYESGSLTYYFAGNYSLPKSPDDVFPSVFLVADAVSATNLPAGVTAGEWSGGVGVTSDSPSYYHLAYRPDPSQEFQFADGSTSVVTLTARVSSVEDAAIRLYVESQTMFAANDQNSNQTFTTEPTITLELRDQSSVLVANATSTDITGTALAVLGANLVGQQVYDLTATISNPAGGRGYVPMIKFDPVALEAT